MNDKLLEAIKARNIHKTEFNYGVLTADRYVQTLQDCVGLDVCNRFASKSGRSFEDLMQKAAKTLVYSNSDMDVEAVEKKRAGNKLRGVELPKNTLMVFQHVLTSSRKDRDGDILRSEGAEVDPSMLLLWQHVSTLPIGKMIKVVSQNRKSLKVISAIVDMNKLCHDAAVMVDNGMGRFSHGFRAMEFEPMKNKEGDTEGFDVKSFEIMEESLVSVPSNVDAETEEVLLSLVEDGKLTSPLMKQVGKGIRERRSLVLPVSGISYRESDGDAVRELTCGSFAELKEAADAGLIGAKNDDDKTGKGTKASLAKEADGKETENETNESGDKEVKWVNESIEGSWEWKRDILQENLKPFLSAAGMDFGDRDCVYVQSLFDDHAIVNIYRSSKDSYHEIDWETQDNKPIWKGEPRPVDIIVNVEAKKRAKLNMGPKLGEFHIVVKTRMENTSAKELMVDFLSVATSWERERMTEALKALAESDKQKEITEQYRDMIGTE